MYNPGSRRHLSAGRNSDISKNALKCLRKMNINIPSISTQGSGGAGKKEYSVVIRSSYTGVTFGCPVTDRVLITSATYKLTSKSISCGFEPFITKQHAQSFCDGSTCRDVKLLKVHNTPHPPPTNHPATHLVKIPTLN